MSTAGWIFLVGMRVFDLGGLIVWLVWFHRHQEQPDDWGDWDDPGREPPPEPPPPAPEAGDRRGLAPLPDGGPWPVRVRDHAVPPPQRTVERRGEPVRRERERERRRERGRPRDEGAEARGESDLRGAAEARDGTAPPRWA